MQYRVRYTFQPSGEVARTYPMSREDAIEIARQFISDGETNVVIEAPDGFLYSVDAL